MTQEQKAKAYDEALERAKKELNICGSQDCDAARQIFRLFPELAESDDERIRKKLITFFQQFRFNIEDTINAEEAITWLEKQDESKVSEPNWCHHKVDLSDCSEEYRKAYYDGWNNCNIQHSQCNEERNDVVKCLINGMKFYYEDNEDATWGTDKWSMPVKHIIEVLEKQGEHKSVDKVEPKFHEGEWIAHEGLNTAKIISIEGDRYEVEFIDGNKDFAHIDYIDRIFHLWTIADAKDGDVLAVNNEVFVYAHRKQLYSIAIAHCFVDSAGVFYLDGEFGFTEKGNSVHPATKEQRELLFQKMKEAGYIWDVEKKEPKKIKDEFKNYKQQVMSEMTDLVKDYIRQKPTKWRPSNAQIGALEHFIRGIGESGHASSYDANLKLVHSLLNDLKKLKEE